MAEVEIDGSIGEGGGQILRIALPLAAITGKSVRIYNIRANRPRPGLMTQHLHVALTVRKISRGSLEGAEKGSLELTFKPGPIVGGRYSVRMPTAASLTLLFQALLPMLLYAEKPSHIEAEGGTDVPFSPTFDYFQHVFLPAVKLLFGAKAGAALERRGFYPEGGGKAALTVEPSRPSFQPLFHEGEWQGYVVLCNLPKSIGIREQLVVEKALSFRPTLSAKGCGRGKGNALTVWRGFVGASAVGVKGKRAEEVAEEVVSSLKRSEGYDVDEHLGDQLLIYAALSAWHGHPTSYKAPITSHLRTAAEVVKAFLPVEVELREGVRTAPKEPHHS